MSIYDPSKANKENWASLVEKQSKGITPDEFTWFTPEDIPMKVLYTAEDTAERGGQILRREISPDQPF